MIKKTLAVILSIIAVVLILAILFALEGLFFWGIGNLFIHAFNINFTFTYLQGVVVGICFSLLGMLIGKVKK